MKIIRGIHLAMKFGRYDSEIFEVCVRSGAVPLSVHVVCGVVMLYVEETVDSSVRTGLKPPLVGYERLSLYRLSDHADVIPDRKRYLATVVFLDKAHHFYV